MDFVNAVIVDAAPWRRQLVELAGQGMLKAAARGMEPPIARRGGCWWRHGWQLSRGGATFDCDSGTLLFGALVAVVFWQIIRWW